MESPDREVKEGSFIPKGPEVRNTLKKIVNIILAVNFFNKPSMRKPMALGKKLLSNNLIGKCVKQSSEQLTGNFLNELKAPTKEEITIPTVTQMAKAGFQLKGIDGGDISKISFDGNTRTLSLPVVELDVNTRVYLRNLVAYEACVAKEELVVARYTELMNGIIDTEQDAKYLQKRKIVVNRLKTDKAVADLWNGMSKSVKLTKVPNMDKVVADVNKMYEQTWRVKLSKFLKKYVFASWKILTLLAALFMLFLTTVQTFCSVYSCARVLRQLPEIPPEVVE